MIIHHIYKVSTRASLLHLEPHPQITGPSTCYGKSGSIDLPYIPNDFEMIKHGRDYMKLAQRTWIPTFLTWQGLATATSAGAWASQHLVYDAYTRQLPALAWSTCLDLAASTPRLDNGAPDGPVRIQRNVFFVFDAKRERNTILRI